MRGPFGSAQNRGGAPSPGLLRNPTSPRTRGEVSACKSCAPHAFFKKTHASNPLTLPRNDNNRAVSLIVKGRQPVTPTGRSGCGSCGRGLVTPALGRPGI